MLKNKEKRRFKKKFESRLWMITIGGLLSLAAIIMLGSCSTEDEPVSVIEPFESEETTSSVRESELAQLLEGGDYVDFFNFLENVEEPENLSIYISDLSLYDEKSNMDREYAVLLPPSFYTDEDRTYPVIYLLHGKGATFKEWVETGQVKKVYDYYLNNGLIPESVIIMPEGGESYYVDGYDWDNYFESFFFSTFMPYVEETYRVDTRKNKRMICGFSMGGYGASYYAFKYYDLFGLCYTMSGVLYGKNVSTTPPVVDFIPEIPASDRPRFIMDIGRDDSYKQQNIDMHNWLSANAINHTFIIREGGHNWIFWRQGIYIAMLKFGLYQESVNPFKIKRKSKLPVHNRSVKVSE